MPKNYGSSSLGSLDGAGIWKYLYVNKIMMMPMTAGIGSTNISYSNMGSNTVEISLPDESGRLARTEDVNNAVNNTFLNDTIHNTWYSNQSMGNYSTLTIRIYFTNYGMHNGFLITRYGIYGVHFGFAATSISNPVIGCKRIYDGYGASGETIQTSTSINTASNYVEFNFRGSEWNCFLYFGNCNYNCKATSGAGLTIFRVA